MRTINLDLYTPHSAQELFHLSNARYRVASLGRQSGKSTMAMNELVLKACNNADTHYWFISPVFSQAKDQYRKLLRYLPREVITKKSDTELRVDLVNKSSIEYKSGEVLDRLRGATLNGVILDEVRDLDSSLWPLVIRPMLTTTQGWAAFISTPNGFDSFYDLFKMSEENSDWESFHAPSTCNPLFTAKELESAKKEMSDDEFHQEIMSEFREVGRGKAYVSHGVWNKRTDNPFCSHGERYSPYLPIIVGPDFNTGLCVWELLQHKGESFYFADEIAIRNTHTQEMAQILVDKVKDHKAGVIIIGDASGKANKTSAVGQTDYSIIMKALKEANVNVRNLTPESNPPVKDRVNLFNSRLKASDGSTYLWYHPERCRFLAKDLERVAWKEGATGAILDKSDAELTHASDGAGYPVAYYTNHLRNRPGGVRVIQRTL